MKFRATVPLLSIGLIAALLGGCTLLQHEPKRPGRTTLSSPLVILPAKNIGNYLIVEAKGRRDGPYHFLIDTGSSITLVSPELAERFPEKKSLADTPAQVRVKSANGNSMRLPTTTMRVIQLEGARFEDVPVLIYDTEPLSAHLGIKIDGILGFPLFRETLLTLDYPQSRVLLAPQNSSAAVPGTPIPFESRHRIPIIPIKIGTQSVHALIDSGSDSSLNLNPAGLFLIYAHPPRAVAYVGTLTGDHEQKATRLKEPLTIAGQTFKEPIVYLTDDLSSLGGEVLKSFTLTFDQERSQVSFHRDSRSPISIPPKRGSGLSFRKTPAYWRVVNILPDSPASAAHVNSGDLVSRINGESVAHWDFERYERLIAEASEATYTFLQGTEEIPLKLAIIDLVP